MRPRSDTVLIFRLGSIGDTVAALPCFHAVARSFPRFKRVLLTNALTSLRASSAESVLQGAGLIDEATYYPVGFSLKQLWKLLRAIRRMRPAALVYLAERPTAAPFLRDIVFFKAAGVPIILGGPWTRDLRGCRVDPSTGELEHESERLARMLGRSLPVNLSPVNWDLRLTTKELATADALVDGIDGAPPLIAIAPGAKIRTKDWGEDHWSELLNSLSDAYRDVGLVIVGAADERALCDRLARLWSGPVLNLCGLLTPRETAAALRRCCMMVCHDSGPMHLAASQGTRCVAIFGNYNEPRKWYPFGTGHRVVRDARGVRFVAVERVASEIRSAFQNVPPRTVPGMVRG